MELCGVFGRSTTGWVGAWLSWALVGSGLRLGDCVAAPAGLDGGMRGWPQQPEASGPM